MSVLLLIEKTCLRIDRWIATFMMFRYFMINISLYREVSAAFKDKEGQLRTSSHWLARLVVKIRAKRREQPIAAN